MCVKRIKGQRIWLLGKMPVHKCRCARNMLANNNITASIITPIQENLQILLGLWATATPTKPDRADTPPILNRVTPENHVKTTPKNQDLPEARAQAKVAVDRKAWAMNEAKIDPKTTKWILATKKGSILLMFHLMLTRARYCNHIATWTVTATTSRGTRDPLSFSPWDKRLDAQLTRAKTQRRGRLDTTHFDSVQRQAWCSKARENLWMVESQRRSQFNLKSHWSNRIIIQSKTFSDRCSKTKRYFWATLGSSKGHRNNRNAMHMVMLDITTITA